MSFMFKRIHSNKSHYNNNSNNNNDNNNNNNNKLFGNIGVNFKTVPPIFRNYRMRNCSWIFWSKTVWSRTFENLDAKSRCVRNRPGEEIDRGVIAIPSNFCGTASIYGLVTPTYVREVCPSARLFDLHRMPKIASSLYLTVKSRVLKHESKESRGRRKWHFHR